jgi:hypothetical protein
MKEPRDPLVSAETLQEQLVFRERGVDELDLRPEEKREQVVEALSFSQDEWLGQHVFKLGFDLQHSEFYGDSVSSQLDIVRLDGSLAERAIYARTAPEQEVSELEIERAPS